MILPAALALGQLARLPVRQTVPGVKALTPFSSTGHPPLPKPKAPKRPGRKSNKRKNKK